MPVVVEDIQHKISCAIVATHIVDVQAVSVGTAPRFKRAVYVFTNVLNFAVLYLHDVLIDLIIHQEVTVWTICLFSCSLVSHITVTSLQNFSLSLIIFTSLFYTKFGAGFVQSAVFKFSVTENMGKIGKIQFYPYL